MRLRRPAHRVDRRAVTWWTLQAAIGWVLVLLPAGVALLVIHLATRAAADDDSGGLPPWTFVAFGAVALGAVTHTLVMPRWRYHVHRWEATDDAVYTQAGWLNIEWRVAPMSRIQTVDTARGPLQQLLGLSTVTVTTASAAGPLHIAGLDAGLASQLVQQLTVTTQATAGDAT